MCRDTKREGRTVTREISRQFEMLLKILCNSEVFCTMLAALFILAGALASASSTEEQEGSAALRCYVTLVTPAGDFTIEIDFVSEDSSALRCAA